MTDTLPIPPLPNDTILLVEVGSTAHGTGLPGGEDHDETAVFIEPPGDVLGPHGELGIRSQFHRTQPEGVRSGPGDIDRNVYSLRHFLRMALTGNPSILFVFWAPVLQSTDIGVELRTLGERLVTRDIVRPYRRYMQRQAERLVGTRGGGHGRRGGGQRTELVEAHGYDTKFAMHCARLGFQCLELLTTGKLNAPMVGPAAVWLRDVRYGNVPFKEWWDVALDLDGQLSVFEDAITETDTIPITADRQVPILPDRTAIRDWSVWAHQTQWGLTPKDS